MENNKLNQEEYNKRIRQGRISKELGTVAEKKFAKIFRDAGWIDAIPMRQVSKLKDDRKLDLHAIPVNSQIKAGSQRNMNIRQVLSSIKEAVAKLPSHYPEHEQHAILIHSQNIRSSEFDDIVSMTFQDYFKLLCMIHNKGIFKPIVTILDKENNIIQSQESKQK
jgi:hypothetical protein